MRSERRNQLLRARSTTSPLSTDEEHDPELTKPAGKAEEITAPDEEDTKQDQAEGPTIPEVATTAIKTASTATFAKSKATDRRNAGKG